jgi:hypothetical protein
MALNLRRVWLIVVIALFFVCSMAPRGNNVISSKDNKKSVTKLTQAGIPLQADPNGYIRWIEAKNGEFNDKAMGYLPDLSSLEWLEIGGGKISVKGLKHLKHCTSLRRLYIHDMNLDGADFSWISSLNNLEALALQNTNIDGEVLKKINAVESLKVLNLRVTGLLIMIWL